MEENNKKRKITIPEIVEGAVIVALLGTAVTFISLFGSKSKEAKGYISLNDSLNSENISNSSLYNSEKEKNNSLNGDISSLESKNNNLEGENSSLEGLVSSAEEELTNQESIISSQEEDLTSQSELISSQEGVISSLEEAAETYTVTYMNNDAVVASFQVKKGESVPSSSIPTVPSKKGNTGAWSNNGTNITGDTIITPVYTPKQYNITYHYGFSEKTLIGTRYKCGEKQFSLFNLALTFDYLIPVTDGTFKMFDVTYTVDNGFTEISDGTNTESISYGYCCINGFGLDVDSTAKTVHFTDGFSISSKNIFNFLGDLFVFDNENNSIKDVTSGEVYEAYQYYFSYASADYTFNVGDDHLVKDESGVKTNVPYANHQATLEGDVVNIFFKEGLLLRTGPNDIFDQDFEDTYYLSNSKPDLSNFPTSYTYGENIFFLKSYFDSFPNIFTDNTTCEISSLTSSKDDFGSRRASSFMFFGEEDLTIESGYASYKLIEPSGNIDIYVEWGPECA